MKTDMSAYSGPAIACLLSLAAAGCGSPAPKVPDTAPFRYNGTTLTFPKGTVDARIEEGAKKSAYARLIPDLPKSGSPVDARYYIDLGRGHTGKSYAGGYWLGFHQYPSNSVQTKLDKDYTMFCPAPDGLILFFQCAVLLRSLPAAAIQFKNAPLSRESARSMVRDAELYLTRAKTRRATDRTSERRLSEPTPRKPLIFVPYPYKH
ncbi:hypothetical protein C8J42_1217 [Sphingomonas sp. PP-CE-1A-559]|jgi:hypothetical protein|nr:hypothetical protein C8J42_1217 [Sphingomonas sp. PP-CE-1A-559]